MFSSSFFLTLSLGRLGRGVITGRPCTYWSSLPRLLLLLLMHLSVYTKENVGTGSGVSQLWREKKMAQTAGKEEEKKKWGAREKRKTDKIKRNETNARRMREKREKKTNKKVEGTFFFFWVRKKEGGTQKLTRRERMRRPATTTTTTALPSLPVV